jgi:GH15 family glucan-1,4-alpha-glucosidase
MPKDFPLGNGNIFVNFDQDYNLRDIYFPYVGLENHTLGHICRFGVWTPDGFAWIGDPEIKCEAAYLEDTLATQVVLRHERLGVELTLRDAVDAELDVLLRRVAVRNLSAENRTIKLYFHLDLSIYGSAIGNTVYFHPDLQSLIFYKRRRYFSLSCSPEERSKSGDRPGFTTGKKHEAGREGTWKDAEDGRLESNPITQGSVDGTLELALDVPGSAERTGWFWVAFGTCFPEVERIERTLRRERPETRLDRTINYWREWVKQDRHDLTPLDPDMAAMYKRSLLIARSHMDNRGAIMAANDSDILKFSKDTYSYMWPRDGALIAHALDRSGYSQLTAKFFEFCRKGLTSEGYLMHKYNPDGSAGSSWHPWVTLSGEKQFPIQEDETALVLFALWHHHVLADTLPSSKDDYEKFVIPTADFLVRYRSASGLPLPSYDLWEERYAVTAFTVSTVYAGLLAAANFADYHRDKLRCLYYRDAAERVQAAALKELYSTEHGRFLRGLLWDDVKKTFNPDLTLDASMYGLFDFGLVPLDDPRLQRTMETLFAALTVRTPVGGIARYEDDYYHQVSRDIDNVPGNPWFICTLWYAEWLIAKAKSEQELEEAARMIRWTHEHALPSGVFAEQVDPYTGEPLSVSPLAWSHSSYVKVVQEYLAKLAEFRASAQQSDKLEQDQADAELMQPINRGDGA